MKVVYGWPPIVCYYSFVLFFMAPPFYNNSGYFFEFNDMVLELRGEFICRREVKLIVGSYGVDNFLRSLVRLLRCIYDLSLSSALALIPAEVAAALMFVNIVLLSPRILRSLFARYLND